MNCKNCGAILDDSASFCNQCGHSTGNLNDNVNAVEYGNYQNNNNNGKKSNIGLIIAIIVIAIILIGGSILGFVLYNNSKDDNSDKDNTSTSTNKDEDEDDDDKDSDKNEDENDDKDADKDADKDDDENDDKDANKDDDENDNKDADKDDDENDDKDSNKDEDKDDTTTSDKDKTDEDTKENSSTLSDSSYITTDDGKKVSFKIPSTLREDTEYSDEDLRCIEKNTEEYSRFVAWISERYGDVQDIMDSMEDRADHLKETEGYSDITLSEIKNITVNGKTFSYRTLTYKLNTTEFKDLTIAYQLSKDSIYYIDIDQFDLVSEDELKALLTITIE